MPRTTALIVAAGRGERAPGGALPKQYRVLAGKPVLRWSLEAFAAHPAVDAIRVVIRGEDEPHYRTACAGIAAGPPILGGQKRQDSVRNGLEALHADATARVLIHDGARPFPSAALIGRVAAALDRADAAAPFLAASDTLRRKRAGGFDIVPRDGLVRAQTPQGFTYSAILAAHRKFANMETTDDIQIAEAAGLSVAPVAGEEINFKLTSPGDFELAGRVAAGANSETRSGTGFDIHRFAGKAEDSDHIWLCGIKLNHDRCLVGHSDADAGLHALTDALLGAISAGDIGQHFPDSDPRWRGAPSHLFLERAAALLREMGGAIVHLDVTLICEQPKIAPHREAMRTRIAAIVAIDIARVSVKATTMEGLGAIGRGEGIAAQAIATVKLPS